MECIQDKRIDRVSGAMKEPGNSSEQVSKISSLSIPQKAASRLVSLDALRGLSIVIMLLVNNFGAGDLTPQPLKHAAWDESIHLADMAFPWFLFCVGVAISFSAASALRRGMTFSQLSLKALKRTGLLFVLGAIVVSADDHQLELISIGILQTIALSYLISTLIYALVPKWRLLIAAIFLVGYWAALKFIPVPGWGAGAFQEDKNLILYLNQTFLSHVGLWNLTRVIPTTALTLIGTFVGDVMRNRNSSETTKTAIVGAIGIVLVGLGYLWNLDLAFNKPLWTPSYVLFAAGAASVTLVALHLIIDVLGWKSWTYPLVIFGSNAILAYVLPILVKSQILIPCGWYIIGWARVIPFIIFWWILLGILYHKRLFIKV